MLSHVFIHLGDTSAPGVMLLAVCRHLVVLEVVRKSLMTLLHHIQREV